MSESFASDVFFTPSVKQFQTARGSRNAYARKEQSGFRTEIDSGLSGWLAERDSLYFATANAEGQPYIQHRGGPPGFLRVLDAQTIAWADYRGNKQYISLGNLAENNKAMLFLMDYESLDRIKIWGTARVVQDDPHLMARLMPQGYQAVPEQVIVFTVSVWDSNCSKFIPRKVPADAALEVIRGLQARVRELEAQLAKG